jgi:hypothetical protein
MTSRRGRFALALFGCSLLVLTGSMQAADHTITISIDSNNNCLQQLDGTGSFTAVVGPIDQGKTIAYTAKFNQAGPILPFEIRLPGASAFHIIGDINASASSVTSPPAFGGKGDEFNYQAVIVKVGVNPQRCTNGRQLGIIMR